MAPLTFFDITLVDMETQGEMDVELHGRIENVSFAIKDVNAAELTMFDDEEVTMTMAQILIKMKAKKARLIDEQMTKRLVKEKFSSAMPNVDKEKALWVELKRLFEPDTDDVLWKLQRYMHYPINTFNVRLTSHHKVSSTTRGHGMFMLTEKNYPLSNGVITLMLSAKLQVEEYIDMARDLVMKISIEGNKPKSKSLDTSSN
nr:hypothetical protein [Tanacetum cinerariifolium]